MKSFLLALNLKFICLYKQVDRCACRIGVGKFMQESVCIESPIQEGKSIQTNVSEWLACITNMNSTFHLQVFPSARSGNDNFLGTVIFRLTKLKIGIGGTMRYSKKLERSQTTIN